MQNILSYLLTVLFFTLQALSYAQLPPDSVNFRSPVGIPLLLAGNFGELRPNHFHSGLDIKTNGSEGYRIYAIEDGYVSRIKVSTWGYGKVLYVTHPNGYTSVYAHLKSFKGEIEAYVKKAQLKNETWEIELYPPDSALPVKKGDIIALSGNTGGSTAPHLHFEIRETKTEFPVNPMLFGFDIKDNIAPVLSKIAFYPLNDSSYIYGENEKHSYALKPVSNNSYQITGNLIIEAYGKVGIGIETIDKMNETYNKYAVYEITLVENNDTIYYHQMQRFNFENTRYVNALMDYEWYKLNKGKIQRSYLLPNNELSIYKKLKNNGEIIVKDGETRHFTYILNDIYGNTSTLNFIVKGKKFTVNNAKVSAVPTKYFEWNKRNLLTENNIIADFPAKTFYKNIAFEFAINDTFPNAITPTYHLHTDLEPVHQYYVLSIKIDSLPHKLREKAVIVHKDFKGTIRAKSSETRRNYISAKVNTLGDFFIMIDSIPPEIKPITIANGKNMRKNSGIMLKITDNLSGIKSYRGEIDGKFVIMEYEYKNATLTHWFDNLPAGKHHFKLTVSDDVGNKTTYEADFYY
jgi:hypothetical protein